MTAKRVKEGVYLAPECFKGRKQEREEIGMGIFFVLFLTV